MIRWIELKRKQFVLLLVVFLLLTLGSLALAQVATPSVWWTVDGGGGTVSGGSYVISGTIGQPEAGGQSSDGHYIVTGGFWGAAGPPIGDTLFLPVLRAR